MSRDIDYMAMAVGRGDRSPRLVGPVLMDISRSKDGTVELMSIDTCHTIKYDPLRPSRHWTMINGSGRVGDFDTIEEAYAAAGLEL